MRKEQIDNYKESVQALLAFTAMVVHDGTKFNPQSAFGFGRRMTTSSQNLHTPDSDVTPDAAVQKDLTFGIATEIKQSLCKDSSRWEKHVKQLRKYDDNLLGWWTEDHQIARYNAVLLVHTSRAVEFADLLSERKTQDDKAVGDHSALVEFSKVLLSREFFNFRLQYGGINDAQLRDDLRKGKMIPFDQVLQSFPNIFYYDHKPPLPLLLEHLWMKYFPTLRDRAEYDEVLSCYKILVRVTDIADEMQRAFGSKAIESDDRSCEFPRVSWIRQAMEELVHLHLAIPEDDERESYTVILKTFQKDALEWFLDAVTEEIAEDSISNEDQLELELTGQ